MSLGLLISACTAHASSFREVQTRVYEHPLRKVPSYEIRIATAIFHALKNLTGELIDRGRITLEDPSDFKPSAPKLIHTLGICAEGIWRIHTPSFATGLLGLDLDGHGKASKASQVRAMVRMSIATPAPIYQKGKKRNFALAIKLFPSADQDEPVRTANILTLDQSGLTGDDRASFFFASNGTAGAISFGNNVPGTGPLAWLGQRTFEKLDAPSTFRALYPLAEVTPGGGYVENPVAPRLIQIVPHMKPKAGPVPADFREEILAYGPHEIRFDLVLPVQHGVAQPLMIGTLELLQPVMSASCDLELTFHHAPENRSLERTR